MNIWIDSVIDIINPITGKTTKGVIQEYQYKVEGFIVIVDYVKAITRDGKELTLHSTFFKNRRFSIELASLEIPDDIVISNDYNPCIENMELRGAEAVVSSEGIVIKRVKLISKGITLDTPSYYTITTSNFNTKIPRTEDRMFTWSNR